MAVLAAYAKRMSDGAESCNLEDFLAGEVFKGAESATLSPTEDGMAGFDRYVANFKDAIGKN
jgi:hypothetical protein